MARKNSQYGVIKLLRTPQDEAIYKGHELTIKARVKLGKIKPENLLIECYYGPLDAHFNINKARRQRMEPGETRDGITEFSTTVKCSRGEDFQYWLVGDWVRGTYENG